VNTEKDNLKKKSDWVEARYSDLMSPHCHLGRGFQHNHPCGLTKHDLHLPVKIYLVDQEKNVLHCHLRNYWNVHFPYEAFKPVIISSNNYVNTNNDSYTSHDSHVIGQNGVHQSPHSIHMENLSCLILRQGKSNLYIIGFDQLKKDTFSL
jgi:hypothetical protein